MKAARKEETPEQAAEAMARRWDLIDSEGQLWCSKDHCDRHGTYPSLLCEFHLLEYRRGR
jgi:hypothetical protein